MPLKQTADELLAFYESEHRNPANRIVHHFAHMLAVTGLFVSYANPLVGIAMIVSALPISWAGHFLFERNTPAFFDSTERGGVSPGPLKKLVVALGGIYWSLTCLVRVMRGQP